MQTDKLTDLFHAIADRIEQEKLFLTELDNVIGDGDHGINLSRGFREVKAKFEASAPATPADVFKVTAMTLISKVGGAAGPLYGTAFLNMAMALNGKTEVTLPDFLAALKSGIEGVMKRGKSTTGEKTMLDAMVPALSAMEEASAAGASALDVLSAGVDASWKGVEYTKTIAATKGRASYLGDRSIGHQDPGATSFTMMLEEVRKAVA